MSASPPQPHLFRRFAETIAIASVGAAALGLAGLPAGWLSGAIIGVSAAALSGRQVFVPPQVGRIVYIILGISPRTIEVHRARIMEKLGAKNAADLVRIVLSESRSA